MKKIIKITLVLVLNLILLGCSKDDSQVNNLQLIDNSSKITKLINGFDETIKSIDYSSITNNDKIGAILIENFKKQGLSIELYSNKSNTELSTIYKDFESKLNTALSYTTKEKYLNHLNVLLEDVKNSDLIILEKQLLVDKILLTKDFVNWMEILDNSKSNKINLSNKTESGWWSSWGKCAASILGGAITGGVSLGIAGAAVGTVTVPIIGTVALGVVGAIGGVIGGGLTGAAAGCS